MSDVISKAHLKFLMEEGYLSKKGIKEVKEVLAGKHDKTRK